MKALKNILSVAVAISLAACGGEDGEHKSIDYGDPAQNILKLKSSIVTDAGGEPIVSSVISKSLHGDSNLFAIDAQGQLHAALESPWPVHFSFSVPAADGQSIYAVVDTHDSVDNSRFIGSTDCGVLKIDLTNNEVSCFLNGAYVHEPENFASQMVNGKSKPFQFDAQGNTYFMQQDYNRINDSGPIRNGFPYLVRVDAGSDVLRKLVDSEFVNSFLVTPEGQLAYVDSKLRLIDNLASPQPSYLDLADNEISILWYGVDKHNTVLFSDFKTTNWLNFSQPNEVHTGVVKSRIEVSSDYGDPQMTGYIVADDGQLYGTTPYIKQMSADLDDYEERMVIKRVIPMSQAVAVDYLLKDSHYTPQRQAHIAQQHLFYLLTDPITGQDVINVVRLSDGAISTLLDDGEYVVDSWQREGQIVHIIGRNSNTQTMFTAQLDAKQFAQGNYQLQINDSAVLDTAVELMPIPQKNSTSSIENVVELESINVSVDDRYSANLQFNQLMDIDSLKQAVSVIGLEPMLVNLGKSYPVIFNTQSDLSQDGVALAFDRVNSLTVDTSKAQSQAGEPLSYCTDGCTQSWTTRSEGGVDIFTAEDDDLTAPFAGKYLKLFGKKQQFTIKGIADFAPIHDLDNGNLKIELTALPNDFRFDVSYETADTPTGMPPRASLNYYSNTGQIMFTNEDQGNSSSLLVKREESHLSFEVSKSGLTVTVTDKQGEQQVQFYPFKKQAETVYNFGFSSNAADIYSIDNIVISAPNAYREDFEDGTFDTSRIDIF